MLSLAVLLGLTVLAGGLLQRHRGIPAPWSWTLAGVGLSAVPSLADVSLPPDVMLFLFLPVLLFWETLNSSSAQIRRNLRVILLLAVGLVFVTAAAVAAFGVLAGLGIAMAVVLGAVVSPTDATAVGTLAANLPRRNAVVLQGESLVNDASALALYTVAVGAALGGTRIGFGAVALDFLWAAGGGVGFGLLSAIALYGLRHLSRRPDLDGMVSMLTPFVLFLPAQLIGASGVVAVVVGGLLLSGLTPRVMSAASRTRAANFWQVSTFAINGALFVLIGLQARSVLETFTRTGWLRLGVLSLGTGALVLVIRFLWIELITVGIRLIDRRAVQRTRRVPIGTRVVTTWAGFRGAVSLAIALAVPVELPGRDIVVAVTFVVIAFTVFVQGAALPVIVWRSRLAPEPAADVERRRADAVVVRDALHHLEEDAVRLQVPDEQREEVRRALQGRLARAEHRDEDEAVRVAEAARDRLEVAMIRRKRDAVLRLRRAGEVDDEVLRTVSTELDVEEIRHTRGDV